MTWVPTGRATGSSIVTSASTSSPRSRLHPPHRRSRRSQGARCRAAHGRPGAGHRGAPPPGYAEEARRKPAASALRSGGRQAGPRATSAGLRAAAGTRATAKRFGRRFRARPLVLTRGRPADIVVINRLSEPCRDPLARHRAGELLGWRRRLERRGRSPGAVDHAGRFVRRPAHPAPGGDVHVPHPPERHRADHVGALRRRSWCWSQDSGSIRREITSSWPDGMERRRTRPGRGR